MLLQGCRLLLLDQTFFVNSHYLWCPVCLSRWAPNNQWRRRQVTNLWCRCPPPAGSSSARDFPLPPFLTPSPGSAYLKMKIFSLFKKLRECGTESSKQRWYWHMTKPQIIVGIKTCLLPLPTTPLFEGIFTISFLPSENSICAYWSFPIIWFNLSNYDGISLLKHQCFFFFFLTYRLFCKTGCFPKCPSFFNENMNVSLVRPYVILLGICT